MKDTPQTTQTSPTSHLERLSLEDAELYRSISPEINLKPIFDHAQHFKNTSDFKSAYLFFERIYKVTRDIHVLLELAHCSELMGDIATAESIYTHVANKARKYETYEENDKALLLYATLYRYTGEEVYLLDRNYLLGIQVISTPSVMGTSMFKPITELQSFPTPSSSPEPPTYA